MTYYHPDLTGTQDDYAVSNKEYVWYVTGQKHEFEDGPVFQESVLVAYADDPDSILTNPADWTVSDSDIDYTAMSLMKTYDPNFSKILIKSITVSRTFSADIRILLSYQKLYPVTSRALLHNQQTLVLRPELITELAQRLAVVEGQIRPMRTVTADATTTPKLMPVDLTGTSATNLVAGESHTIDTFNGKNVIRPVHGAYYAGSLTLRAPERQYTLVKNVDYITFGTDLPKTATTEAADEVCNFILLTYAYAGEITATYQAYGGEVTVYDLSAVYAKVNQINRYLTDTVFLTETALPQTFVVQQLMTRIEELSNQMRILNTAGGVPNYGDSTNGTSRRWSLQATNTQLHWWPIATLYTTLGGNTVTTADRMKFRIELTRAKLMADVIVAVDLDAEQIGVESSAVIQDIRVKLYDSVSLLPVCMPQFRVCFNKTVGVSSGAVLQIGLSLPDLTEIIGIEDVSGIESSWIVNPANATQQTPKDNGFLLPDGTSVWDTTNADSVALTRMMPNKTGYLLWHGAKESEEFTLGSPFTIAPADGLLPTSFRVDDVKEMVLEMSTTAGMYFQVVVPVSGVPGSGVRTGFGAFPSATLWGNVADGTRRTVDAGLNVNITQAVNGQITTVLEIQHVLANYQDTALRYIFVKV